MNRSSLVAASVLAILVFLVPAATAAVTVTVEKPSGPIAYDAPTPVSVTLSADCATVLTEYEVAGKTELTLAALDAPPFLPASGETVPFTTDMCDPATATVSSTGALTFTPGPLAPGLRPIKIQVGAQGEEGSAAVDLIVAFRGTINASAAPATINNGTADATLVLEMDANADGLVMLIPMTPPTSGTISGLPDQVEVESPLVINETTRVREIPFTYTAKDPMNATVADSATYQVMLHAADDMSVAPVVIEVTLTFEPGMAPVVEEASGKSPGVEPVLMITVIGATVFLSRRRRA